MNTMAGRQASLVQRSFGLSDFLFRCGFPVKIGRTLMLMRSPLVVLTCFFDHQTLQREINSTGDLSFRTRQCTAVISGVPGQRARVALISGNRLVMLGGTSPVRPPGSPVALTEAVRKIKPVLPKAAGMNDNMDRDAGVNDRPSAPPKAPAAAVPALL
jgi:hypothetical protein